MTQRGCSGILVEFVVQFLEEAFWRRSQNYAPLSTLCNTREGLAYQIDLGTSEPQIRLIWKGNDTLRDSRLLKGNDVELLFLECEWASGYGRAYRLSIQKASCLGESQYRWRYAV